MSHTIDYSRIHISRRKLLAFALAAVMIGGLIGGALWSLGEAHLFEQSLTRFASYDELVNFLKKGTADIPTSLYQKFQSLLQGDSTFFRALEGGAPGFAEDSSGQGSDYSTTNIQVAGVDEADIVKTDGTYLYIAVDSIVYLVLASPPEAAEVLSKLVFTSPVAGLFINDEHLIVFQGSIDTYRFYEPYSLDMTTTIQVYDVTDKAQPVLERQVTIDGLYFSSRMIGDYVYAVINEPAILVNGSEVLLPEVQSGSETTTIDAADIYHTDFPNNYDVFTTVIAINVQDATQKPRVETYLLGSTSCIYVAMENIYLTSPAYSSTFGTNIHRVFIQGGEIAYKADGVVPGYVLNQFSMDEEGAFFRIATTDGEANNVYVLDQNLEVQGALEGLAPGEQIYSARFIGERCYLVTFRKVDPLFVIDLQDPQNPSVLGKLKIPGYSDYLHPYDETHLIGVGKETVPAENGDFSWFQGVKISLFDVSDVANPKEIAKLEIGDRGTDSPVLRDHKAFLFDQARHLLVLPILLAEKDPSAPPSTPGDFVYQGAYVLHVSVSDGILLQGRITHIADPQEFLKSGYYFSSPYSVERSLYIDQTLYTISDKLVKLNNLQDLSEIGVVELV